MSIHFSVLLYFQLFVENLFALASFLLFFGTCDTCPAEIQSSVTFLYTTIYKSDTDTSQIQSKFNTNVCNLN